METKWISLTDWLKETSDKKQALEKQTQELKQHPGIKEAARILREGGLVAVSYTHLTLPTICSV